MKIPLFLPTFAAAVCAAMLLSACSAPGGREDAAVRKDVEALLRNWSSAGQQKRWDDLKALYADEAGFVWIEQGRVAYADHAAIVAGVDAASGAGADIRASISDIAVTPLSADAAAFHAMTSLQVKSDQFAFSFDGVVSGVAVKRAGGWKLLQGHLSAPTASAR